MPSLRDIYKKHTGKYGMPGSSKFMSCVEFEELIVEANCLNDRFGSNQLAVQFNLSMMTQVEEIASERHLNM